MESSSRVERDVFRKKLKEEWGRLWSERFDDRVRAEGVSVSDYPLLFMSRGHVIFATRDAKAPCFSEILDSYAAEGMVYSPDPSLGGWGKFIRTELQKDVHSRARALMNGQSRSCQVDRKNVGQSLKKSGRGWLHI